MPSTNYYHFEKPLFHSTKSSHGDLNVFLDFNKKDKLQGFYYTCDDSNPWLDSLSKLAKDLEGKDFIELQSFEYKDQNGNGLFNLPHFLLKDALDRYRGKSPPVWELKGEPKEDLICRCFGIYKEELIEVLEQLPESKNSDLTNKTKAGAGCTACLSEFPQIFAEAKSRQARKLLDT